jgi:hypothetical protein
LLIKDKPKTKDLFELNLLLAVNYFLRYADPEILLITEMVDGSFTII